MMVYNIIDMLISSCYYIEAIKIRDRNTTLLHESNSTIDEMLKIFNDEEVESFTAQDDGMVYIDLKYGTYESIFGDFTPDDFKALILDGNTYREAERSLNRGTAIVYSAHDFEVNFNDYMEQWGINQDQDELDEFRAMLDYEVAVADWSIIKIDGEVAYYIEYIF